MQEWSKNCEEVILICDRCEKIITKLTADKFIRSKQDCQITLDHPKVNSEMQKICYPLMDNLYKEIQIELCADCKKTFDEKLENLSNKYCSDFEDLINEFRNKNNKDKI